MPWNVASGMPFTTGVERVESNSKTKETNSNTVKGVAGRNMTRNRCADGVQVPSDWK